MLVPISTTLAAMNVICLLVVAGFVSHFFHLNALNHTHPNIIARAPAVDPATNSDGVVRDT